MVETFSVQLPGGRVVTKELPSGATDAQVRAAFAKEMKEAGLEVRRSPIERPEFKGGLDANNAAFQGGLSEPDVSLTDRITDGISNFLGRIGVGDRYSRHVANRATGFLNDLTPVGDAVSADQARRDFNQGNYLGALGNSALAALGSLPIGGDLAAGAAKAMFLGPMAKNANLDALRRAEGMAQSGADRRQIWDETGWFQGTDGKWRFEIDDSNSGFRRDLLRTEHHAGRRYEVGALEDALEHPEFHRAYPDAGEMEVANYSFDNRGTAGTYHPPGKLMPEQIAMWDDGSRSTLHHEAQHAVQQREGFAKGGSAEYLKDQIPNPKWEQWNAPENRAIADEYAKLVDSPEYFQQLQDWNAEWSRTFAPRLDALEAAQDTAGRSGFNDIQPQIEALFAEANQFERQTYPVLGRALALADSGIVREPSRHLNGGEAYRRLAGEVEARNVQKRLDMTPDERKAAPPWETEDVAREDQIVRENMLGNLAASIRAWHGSPHDFDRFDMSKIGTGEGAQSYGHGLYFAENKKVAEEYQRQLSGRSGVTFRAADGTVITPQQPNTVIALEDIVKNGGAVDWLNDAEQWLDQGVTDPAVKELVGLKPALLGGKLEQISQGAPGRLYEVNINAEPEDFLDWDRPLSEQPSGVQSAFETFPQFKEMADRQNREVGDVYAALTDTASTPSKARLPVMEGHRAYRALDGFPLPIGSPYVGLGQAKAPRMLNDLGIPGIRYLDQGSRNALGNLTHNYVVFDDGLIDILNKF